MSLSIYQTKQIRELEKNAGERFNISADVMMQRAGKSACDYLMRLWPNTRSVGVVAGSGNNGGDGYVLALSALKRGLQVHVWQVGKNEKLTGAALHAFESCRQAGVPIHAFNQQTQFDGVDVLIDAMLGIGLQGDVRPEMHDAINAINQANLPVLAMDIPSGIEADTGKVKGAVVDASATITFIGLKLGLLTGQGVSYVGELHCDTLHLPEELYQTVQPIAESIFAKQFSTYLAPRPKHWHKGHGGHVLLIGGDQGYSGAIRLAAESALRVGAGLVSVATRQENAVLLNAIRPEIMSHGVESVAQLMPLLEKATVIVIGPGLGLSVWGKNLFDTVIKSEKPLIIDADGLNQLAETSLKKNHWILTPHPGEAARLLKTTSDIIQQNRLAAILNLQKTWGGVCVLKGAGSLIAGGEGLPALCEAGNPGMGTAGMGDILTGVIAGLVAQGISLTIAAKLGVCLHAEAGDLAAGQEERGLIASDLLLALRVLVNPDEN